MSTQAELIVAERAAWRKYREYCAARSKSRSAGITVDFEGDETSRALWLKWKPLYEEKVRERPCH